MPARLVFLARIVVLLGIAAPAALAQTTPSPALTPRPAVSPTNPVPERALTPGADTLTPGATRSGGTTNLYSIPPTTPAHMPAYTITGTGSAGTATGEVLRPISAADCAGDAWRRYPALEFKNRQNCETWVAQHPQTSGAAGMGTPSGIRGGASSRNVTPVRRATTPRARRTRGPAATTPSAKTPAAR